MVPEAPDLTAKLSPSERNSAASQLMRELAQRLRRNSDYATSVVQATLTTIPGEVGRLAENGVLFRSRGDLHSFRHIVSGSDRRMEIERWRGRKGGPLKWMDKVVLEASGVQEEKDGQVHYHKEVMQGKDQEPLNDSPEAIRAVRRFLTHL